MCSSARNNLLTRCGLTVLATAALGTGCGGGSYTKSDFIARADAICASSLRQVRALTPQGGGGYIDALLPILRSEAAKLRALPRPSGTTGEAAVLARYYGSLERDVATYRRLATAASRGDLQGVATAEASLRASPTTALATSYGFSACGSAGATVP